MTSYRVRAVRDWLETAYLVLTPSLVAKSSFFYVQEIGHFKTLPNFCTEREGLLSLLVVYTISGKGYLKYEGKTYELKPNQAFFIDCENYQYYETDKVELWEFNWVHFYGGTSKGYYDQFRKNGAGPAMTFPGGSLLPKYIQQLIEFNKHKDARTEIISSGVIMDILTELLLRSVTQNHEVSPSFLPEYIRNIKVHLENECKNKITLDQLAVKFGVSKYHLIRKFKKYIGQTPNEYLISTRINLAKDLLKNSTLSIVEIAEEIGFGYVSHFINAFKKHEESTPLVYRNKWR